MWCRLLFPEEHVFFFVCLCVYMAIPFCRLSYNSWVLNFCIKFLNTDFFEKMEITLLLLDYQFILHWSGELSPCRDYQ